MFFQIFKNHFKPLTLGDKIKLTGLSYLFILVGVITSVMFIQITDVFITRCLEFPSIKNLIHQSSIRIDKAGIIKISILVPLIEEILFRLFLRPSKNNLRISFSFITFFIINKSFFSIDFYDYKLYLAIVIVILINLILTKKFEKIQSFIEENQKLLIITSIAIFGLVHIGNIDTFYWQLSLFYPIYIIPQIIMGYFITNLRLKLGFIWGFFLHLLINFVGTIFS